MGGIYHAIRGHGRAGYTVQRATKWTRCRTKWTVCLQTRNNTASPPGVRGQHTLAVGCTAHNYGDGNPTGEPPYPSLGNFTSTPVACRHLRCQFILRFLAFSVFSAPLALGVEGIVSFSPGCSPLGVGLGAPLPSVGGLEDLRPPPRLPLPGDFAGFWPPFSGLPLPAFLRRSSSAFLSFSDSKCFMWHSSS